MGEILTRGRPAPPPLQPLSDAELRADWTDDVSEPVVSVLCHSYAHEPYLADALAGFLAQRTRFPFEIVVHDDCSPDGSQALIESFRSRYPSVIRTILQETNQYGKHRPWEFTLPAARGRYVIICEGDDYWTDPLKLQKQVDALEARPDLVMVGHGHVRVVDGRVDRHFHRQGRNHELSRDDLLYARFHFHTTARLFRRPPEPVPAEVHHAPNVDTFLLSWLGKWGGARYLDDVAPTVYRQHGGGVWASRGRDQRAIQGITTNFWMGAYHARVGNPRVSASYYARAARKLLKRAGSLESGEAAKTLGMTLQSWSAGRPLAARSFASLRNLVRPRKG